MRASLTFADDVFIVAYEADGWASTERWTPDELRSLGWDGTQEGLSMWLTNRIAERKESDDGYRAATGQGGTAYGDVVIG